MCLCPVFKLRLCLCLSFLCLCSCVCVRSCVCLSVRLCVPVRASACACVRACVRVPVPVPVPVCQRSNHRLCLCLCLYMWVCAVGQLPSFKPLIAAANFHAYAQCTGMPERPSRERTFFLPARCAVRSRSPLTYVAASGSRLSMNTSVEQYSSVNPPYMYM